MDDSAVLISRLKDAVKQCVYKDTKVLGFFDEREISILFSELKFVTACFWRFFGGHNDSVRKCLCISSDKEPEDRDYPISVIAAEFPSKYKLSHRDFLGSIMSLNIKRESIGDIAVSDGIAYIFVRDEISSVLLCELSKVGNVGIKISKIDPQDINIEQKYELCQGIVASERLDCIIAMLISKSRRDATEMILSGLCSVNYELKKDVSFTVKEESIISIRGYGKFRIGYQSGITHKGRIKLKYEKFC